MDDIIQISDPSLLRAALSAATLAIVEVVKRVDVIPQPERWLPLVSLTVGVALGLFYKLDLLEAIMIGTAANGVFELGKRSIAGRTA